MELMVDQAMRLAHLGEAYLQIGQVEQATSIAHLALQTSLNYQQRGADAWTQWLLGEINTRADNLGAAEGHYCKAMALASKLGMAPNEGWSLAEQPASRRSGSPRAGYQYHHRGLEPRGLRAAERSGGPLHKRTDVVTFEACSRSRYLGCTGRE
jgi:hypothetical protein